MNEEDIKNWYNKRHISLGKNSWRPPDAYPIILDYINPEPGKKMLDIGCGTGYLLKAADEKGLKTYGVDISEQGVKIAKEVSPNSQISVGSGEKLDFPNEFFDYVTCIGALEHFLDIRKGLKEMERVVKGNGKLCVVVPNSNFLYWKIKKIKGTEQQDINENLLSLEEWKNKFAAEGLKVLNIYQDKWFMKETKIFSSFNFLQIIKKAIYKLVWLFLPLNYTYQFIFILSKKINLKI